MKNIPTIHIAYLKPTDNIIKIKGFISQKNRGNTANKHLTLRQQSHTIICTIPEDNEELQQMFGELTLETFVVVTGVVYKATAEDSQAKDSSVSEAKQKKEKNLKITANKIQIQGLADKNLPFLLKDVNTPIISEDHVHSTTLEAGNIPPTNANMKSMGKTVMVKYDKCLNHRALYLRSSPSTLIFKILDTALFTFRTFLKRKGFTEITTPKLISGASEGGSNVFEVKFFKKKAYLAQSPQLYKQMAIIGGMEKVFEVGHVYRQEESNINKYLSEFTGLDFEMEIGKDYMSLIRLVYKLLSSMIYHIQKSKSYEELKTFRSFKEVRLTKNPVILTHKKCVEILRTKGIEIGDLSDFSREQEKKLGEFVAEKYEVDLFCIKDYPTEVRAFYSKPHSEGPYSLSYDFILRGEEICSGAERINCFEELTAQINKRGIDTEHLKYYLESFKWGVPRHGGVGIGAERFLKNLFGFDDIRYFSLFPRDPKRLDP
ncbi:putative aspartate--tRNA ligase, cytoplasmic [Cucumispora dikerogammari]|nr:putative aspartate--tRNA ligase, cytoplasmic [Cucumispora dikerogammari]